MKPWFAFHARGGRYKVVPASGVGWALTWLIVLIAVAWSVTGAILKAPIMMFSGPFVVVALLGLTLYLSRERMIPYETYLRQRGLTNRDGKI